MTSTRMHLILIIFRYFPHGGLQRDMRLIAEEAVQRGHRVTILCQRWSGEHISGTEVVTFAPLETIGKLSSPWRNRRFFTHVSDWLCKNQHNYVLAMNKMALLDVHLDGYFQGDECFVDAVRHQRPFWYRFTPRARHFLASERAVFTDSDCQLFMLSPVAATHFTHYYGSQTQSRMMLLRAGLPSERIWRKPIKMAVDDVHIKLLFVASNFQLKGLDRAIQAIAALENQKHVSLTVVGGNKVDKFHRLVNKRGINVTFLGACDDVIAHMRDADLLIHPARMENAGMVILEALANALPVLTTANCGYAPLVEKNRAGHVIGEPFRQSELNSALAQLLSDTETLTKLAGNAYRIGKTLGDTTLAEQILDNLNAQIK